MLSKRLSQLSLLILVCFLGVSSGAQERLPSLPPEKVVEAFYRYHFAHDMAFSEAAVKAKASWFTAGLYNQLITKLRRPVPKVEVPDIDGDPFTDSQEYPASFKVTGSSLSGEKATVTVEFSWPQSKRAVQVALLLQDKEWLIDNIVYAPDGTLRKLLAP